MLQHHLRLAIRNLWKTKGHSAILIAGLALGLVTCLFIALWVNDERSYDRFHTHAERIFRITEKISTDGTGEYCASAPIPLGPTVLQELPGIVENQTRLMQLRAPSYLLENGAERRFNESRLYFADPGVFNMFSFRLLRGDANTALQAPNTVVLTESAAQKYFGAADPLGKTLRFEGTRDLVVSAVAADVPGNSHLHFDVLVSFSTLDQVLEERLRRNFYWNPAWTYVLLKESATQAQLEAALPGIVQKYFPPFIRPVTTLPVQALTNIHLYSNGLVGELEPNGSDVYIRIFSAVAAFVLLIAVINFINLSTAQSLRRLKEIGLRKTLGAGRRILLLQMLSEAVLVGLTAGGAAFLTAHLALPFFNQLTDKTFTQVDLWSNGVWFALAAFGTGLLAGFYPAFYLSGFRPALAVKGVMDAPALKSRTQQGLVIAQFAISIVLLIGMLVSNRQFNYLREARLGYDRDGVLILPVSRCALAELRRFDDFKRQLLQNSNIKNVTALEEPLGVRSNTGTYRPEGLEQDKQFSRLFVRPGFLETFDIQLAAGRSFSEHPTADSTNVIVNEALVRHLGWGSAENALQKRLGGNRIVGVAKDFHFASLHSKIEPLVLHVPRNDQQNGFFVQFMAVKIAGSQFQESLDFLKRSWEQQVPDRAFEYSFLDDDHARLYRSEARLGRIALVFNILSLFIACMGLVGLAAYLLAQRTKEIGIRKTLGASVAGITGLLAKDFLKLVFIAILIASPAAWYLMRQWLAGFAYRIDLQSWMFVAAGAAALLIAFLTVGFQSVRAALANPVKSLRSE
jgi:putative ABC transport system permease protein